MVVDTLLKTNEFKSIEQELQMRDYLIKLRTGGYFEISVKNIASTENKSSKIDNNFKFNIHLSVFNQ